MKYHLERLASSFLRAAGEKDLAVDYDAKLKREQTPEPPEEYKSRWDDKLARSVFGQRRGDEKFLRVFLEDAEFDHMLDNEPGHEDWRDPDELYDD